ncbi:MAG: chromosomal replication initiator protein DnaA [Candidatus Dojkabacteria bacterium]|nr:chromosomal replication initiator protein DnaA [Candidatus Dojkabacteria bacterium]
MFNNDELTKLILEILQTKLPNQIFSTYFANSEMSSNSSHELTITVKNLFAKENIERKYIDTLSSVYYNITKSYPSKISIKTNNKHNPKESLYRESTSTKKPSKLNLNSSKPTHQKDINYIYESNLNPKYTFETFIVGTNNQLAHAAAVAISENPGHSYNPFFVYGDVGLGKTHLIQSIGNKIIRNNPTSKVLYTSTESFLNDMITSIKSQKNVEFRKKYREVDVLILDDIQFISNRTGLQEEFFNTFNFLYQAGKQIVIASDRPPSEIEHLESRIRSRFEGGLVADIKSPNFETRVAILRQKVEEKNFYIPDKILELIAMNIETNIRELEGALLKVILLKTTNPQITDEEIKIALGFNNKSLSKKNRLPTPNEIIENISTFLNVSVKDLKSPKRTTEIGYARHLCMYLLKDILNLPLAKIAKQMGRKDHTTVIHAIKKISELIEKQDPTTLQIINEIKKSIFDK